jgi:DNA-directed RNA polymerase subunit K/omega
MSDNEQENDNVSVISSDDEDSVYDENYKPISANKKVENINYEMEEEDEDEDDDEYEETKKEAPVMKDADDEDDDDDDEDEDDDDDADIGEYDFAEPIDKRIDKRKSKKDKDVLPISMDMDEDEMDDEDDEEEDDDYLQKFDSNIQRNVIAEHHPEMVQHNYEEIEALSKIVRNEMGVIIDPLHKTLPFLTKYEKARILGERAKQINAGGKPFIPVEINMIDGYLIAMKELEEKKIPFIIKRPMPNGGCEYWKLKDLEILL